MLFAVISLQAWKGLSFRKRVSTTTTTTTLKESDHTLNPPPDKALFFCNQIFSFGCHSVNVTVGEMEHRIMMTGWHTVADIFCVCCGSLVGWKYVQINTHHHLLILLNNFLYDFPWCWFTFFSHTGNCIREVSEVQGRKIHHWKVFDLSTFDFRTTITNLMLEVVYVCKM